jgi:hypothetical protein
MAEKLKRWLIGFQDSEVLTMVREHLNLTQTAVEELHKMICDACESSLTKHTLYDKISEVEMKADELRRDMINILTESGISPIERQDLMDLVRAIDWVADWAREAGRILVIIPFESAPDAMKKSVQDMTKACTSAIRLLSDCVDMLLKDKHQTLELANKVEMIEVDIDEMYSIALGYIARLDFSCWSSGSLILLAEFLQAIEMVSDWCEKSVDLIRAIAIRN